MPDRFGHLFATCPQKRPFLRTRIILLTHLSAYRTDSGFVQ